MQSRILLATLAVSAVACSGSGPGTSAEPMVGDVTFLTDGGEVRAFPLRVADSPEERAQGLMGVARLGKDDGMLFVFDEPTGNGFWMKETLIPLDVAFWGSDGRIHAIIPMSPCPQEPCPTYAPDETYSFALEMHEGWFARQGIEVGDHADARLLSE